LNQSGAGYNTPKDCNDSLGSGLAGLRRHSEELALFMVAVKHLKLNRQTLV